MNLKPRLTTFLFSIKLSDYGATIVACPQYCF